MRHLVRRRHFAVLLTVALIGGVMALAAPATGIPAPTNLVVNGDFEAGNTGFMTEYNYVDHTGTSPAALGPPFVYAIGTDPSLYHPAWGSFTDPDGSLMMIVNGTSVEAGEPNKLVWGQDVSLGTPAYPEAEPYPLYAGQDELVGTVLVSFNGDEVCVELELDPEMAADGYGMTEVHIAIGNETSDIPHNKSGNPVPGNFPINIRLPGVAAAGPYCFDLDDIPGFEEDPVCDLDDVVIAAHAVVFREAITEFVDTGFCAVSGIEATVGAVPATLAWVHPGWNPNMTEDLAALGANWIWDTNPVSTTVADLGGMVDFQQVFNIVGTPTAATLKIAADNAFAWHINGGTEEAVNLGANWAILAGGGDFTYPNVVVDPLVSAWGQVYTRDVLGNVAPGTNTLYVTGVNANWATTDPHVNPAGVIYQVCVEAGYDEIIEPEYDETAWGRCDVLGEGDCELPGSNWATYIRYNIPCESDCAGRYRFTMWGASTYPAAPAQLQINGVGLGNLDLSSTVGQWLSETVDWDSPGACTAALRIIDARYTYSGDDFVIDDISLVKLVP